MDKVRFGIVGCGNMGTGHAKNFLANKIENGYISAVCDIDPDRFDFFILGFKNFIEYPFCTLDHKYDHGSR